MFTVTDVLIIVLFTFFATAIITTVVISCAIANGLDEDKTKAYWKGYADGKKEGGESEQV